MIIPNKLIIGRNIYKIKIKRILDWTNKDICGHINYHKAILKIKKTNNNRSKEDTLFHEIAHGLLKELEFNHPQISKFRDNEIFVQELGLNLRKTFLDLLKKQREEK